MLLEKSAVIIFIIIIFTIYRAYGNFKSIKNNNSAISTTENTIREQKHQLEELNKNGNTIILVTHEEDIAKNAHRIVKLRDGLIEADYRK